MTDHTTHFTDEQAMAALIRHVHVDDCTPATTAWYRAAGRALLTLEAERDAFVVEAAEYHNECVKLRAERDALRLRVAALEAALREAARWFDPRDTHGNFVNSTEQRDRILAALSGDTTALRAMLVGAFDAGFREREGGERWDGYSDGNDYAAGILGASKEGGE